MKKTFLLFAALFTATVMNLQATPDYLYFTSLKGGTVQLSKRGAQSKNLSATFQYSTDGTNWNDYAFTQISLNKNQTVWFRANGTGGKNNAVGLSTTAYFQFTFNQDDSIAAGGNVMSLYDASCEQTTMTEYGFYRLFQSAAQLVSAPKLPATTLAQHCYDGMFANCNNLTTAPESLPAKNMAPYCYQGMFNSCVSLATAPEIKAETLASYCFKQMFQSCGLLGVDTCANDAQCEGALLTVPATSADNWNTDMFKNCLGDYTDVKCGGHYSVKKYDKPQAYVKADGSIDTCKTYTLVCSSANQVTWNAGWYVVKGAAVKLAQGGAICKGEVHLILADGAKLTTKGGIGNGAGIKVSGDNNSLTIYGQEGQTGKLIATGINNSAGIGGGNNGSGSNITINGGVIEATGAIGGAGIGGGFGASGSYITINGGTVTATTNIEIYGGAGIGGGQNSQGSHIYINGGTVTAIGADGTAGIGAGQGDGGSASNIFISPFVILKADNNNPPTTMIAHTSDDAASLLAGKQYATAVVSPCYAYNNWETESTWSWKQMDSVGRNTYQLENVVFGGTGINFNGKEDNAGAIFVNVSDFAGDAVQAKDTVSFTFNTLTHVVTMTLVGRPAVDYACQIGTKGYASIAEAVAAVQAGDTIQVLKDIQLDAMINVTSSTPAFTLDLNGHILDGSNLTGNNASLIRNEGTLSIIDSDPTATHEAPFDTIAGAILTGGKGWKYGTNIYGGAIYSKNGTLNINGVAFVNNSATYGGAAWVDNTNSTFTNCRFYGNIDTDRGAAVGINNNSQCSIDSCFIKGNSTTLGTIYAYKSSLTIAHTTITGNTSSTNCGAMYVLATSLTLNDGTVITNNTDGSAFPSGGAYVWTDATYKNSITLSGKVIIKDNTSNGQPANLCLSGNPVCDEITLNGLSEGSEVYISTLDKDDAPAPRSFVANATEADLQYFKSDDGYAFVLDKNGKIVAKEAYGRKVTSGNFGTICLDKQFIAMEGVEGLYVPYMVNGDSLYCEEMPLDSVKAGYAYIFKSNADSVTFALEGEAVAAAIEANYMKGWLAEDYTLLASDVQAGGDFYDRYFMVNNEITKPLAESQILKNRAIIQLPGSAPSAPARGRLVAFGLNDVNTPTGVVDVNANVNANRKMMKDGQLIIIRDGRKFNAQGQEL